MQSSPKKSVCSPAAMTALFAVATIVTGSSPSALATVFPANGGQGDRSELYTCPQYHVLVGFHGRTGAWIDQIGLLCAEFSSPSWTRGSLVRQGVKGGAGGTPQEQYCAGDSAIREIRVTNLFDPRKMSHRLARSVKFSCSTPRDGSVVAGSEFVSPSINYGMDLSSIQGGAQSCPGSEYATGLNIRYGKHVNAIGLICGSIENRHAAPAAVSATPPGPGMEVSTDRPGSDYDKFHINDQRPDRCQSECARQSDRCRAWTYVQPGIQHKLAVCYLKSAVPPPTANNCCTSGVQKKIVGLGRR